jgi:Ca2+-binding RTX toxin-like protein
MAQQGTNGNDVFRCTVFDDEIFGFAGDDFVFGSPGEDAINGGSDNDTVDYLEFTGPRPYLVTIGAAVNVDLERAVQSGGFAEGDVLISIENVSGTRQDDMIAGNGGDNELFGNGGDDILDGRGGDDVLLGDGTAFLAGGPDGNDTLIGGTGVNLLDGGTGTDTASYATAAAGVVVSIASLAAVGTGIAFTLNGDTSDSLRSIENLTGSDFADQLTGSSAANVIDAGGGDDVISGGSGADVLNGGAGIDTATYGGSNAGVTVTLGVLGTITTPFGTFVVQFAPGTGTGGAAQGDTLSGIENLTGSSFNDVLTGSLAANTLDGGGGADTLIGGAGADVLNGGSGIDTLSYAGSSAAVLINLGNGQTLGGHAQGDTFTSIENLAGSGFADALFGDGLINTIDGAAGADSLFGGLNNDTFVFVATQANGDTLIDFEGNGAGAGDQIHFVGYGAGTLVQIDATRWLVSSQDGASQEIITLANAALIDASDFLFV